MPFWMDIEACILCTDYAVHNEKDQVYKCKYTVMSCARLVK